MCSSNAAALGADELEKASEFQDELMAILEKCKQKEDSKNTELDEGDISEITVDRPVIPTPGGFVQTRAAEGAEWSPVAVIIAVGEDDHLGELKIVGMEGNKQHQMPHWAPMQPPLMRRAECRGCSTIWWGSLRRKAGSSSLSGCRSRVLWAHLRMTCSSTGWIWTNMLSILRC